jgi:tetratricopeptide (TPR) repeat protein
VANGYEVLAIALHFKGSWQRGLHLEIERLGTALDTDTYLAHVVDMHHCLGQQHLYQDRSRDQVEGYARRTIDIAARAGARRAEAFGWCLLGESLLLEGRWEEAVTCLRRSIAIRQQLGPETVALPWQRLAEIAVFRGEPPDDYLLRGRAIATTSPMAMHAWGRLYATECLDALERGDGAGALRAVESAAAAASRYGECPGCCTMLHPVAAEAYALVGDASSAEGHAEQADRVAARWESTAIRAMAETAHGCALLARGEAEDAAERFLSASRLHEGLGHPFWTARTLAQAGRGMANAGRTADGAALLRQAVGGFERLGATRALARAERTLADVAP